MLALTGLASVALWFVLEARISIALRETTGAIAHLCGLTPAHRGIGGPTARRLEEDQLAILFAVPPGGERLRRYVVELGRWHVNLIILPPLALSIGGLSLRRRLLLLGIGLPILLVADAVFTLAYVSLAISRLRAETPLPPALQRSLEYGISAVGLKVLPIAVWGAVYGVLRRRAARS